MQFASHDGKKVTLGSLSIILKQKKLRVILPTIEFEYYQ